jgi:hypothetical protein
VTMSRTAVYVPSNFTVEKGAVINFENCAVIERNEHNMLHANVFMNRFKGEVNLIDSDIYIDDSTVKFIDKIEAYAGAREELLA